MPLLISDIKFDRKVSIDDLSSIEPFLFEHRISFCCFQYYDGFTIRCEINLNHDKYTVNEVELYFDLALNPYKDYILSKTKKYTAVFGK